MIGQKISKFDNSIDNSLLFFEKLFNVKIKGYPKNSTVEIMNLMSDGKRRILINNDVIFLEIDKPSKTKPFDFKKKSYKYQAFDFNGNVLANDYTIKGLSKKLKISDSTVLNILKNKPKKEYITGRPSKKIIIKKILMSNQERIKNKTSQNKQKKSYEVFKNKKSLGVFKGQALTAKKIGVTVNTLARYLRGEIKNSNGYTVKRVF